MTDDQKADEAAPKVIDLAEMRRKLRPPEPFAISVTRTLAQRERVDFANQRFNNKNNSKPSLKIESSAEIPRIAAPPRSEPVSHSHLRVVQIKRGKYG